jgi:hypothetical protein
MAPIGLRSVINTPIAFRASGHVTNRSTGRLQVGVDGFVTVIRITFLTVH